MSVLKRIEDAAMRFEEMNGFRPTRVELPDAELKALWRELVAMSIPPDAHIPRYLPDRFEILGMTIEEGPRLFCRAPRLKTAA